MVILDTNIIIDHIRQKKGAETALKKIVRTIPKEAFFISIITIQELYEGKSTKGEEEDRYLLATIAPLKILPYSYETAKLAGEIARDSGKPLEFPDAAIAATAIINNCELFTLNKKDFQTIKDLRLFSF